MKDYSSNPDPVASLCFNLGKNYCSSSILFLCLGDDSSQAGEEEEGERGVPEGERGVPEGERETTEE